MNESATGIGKTLLDGQAQEIDEACDRFEQAWKTGAKDRRPRIKDYLVNMTGLARATLLRELVLLEVFYCRQGGESVSTQEYLCRFPELEPAWLEAMLA